MSVSPKRSTLREAYLALVILRAVAMLSDGLPGVKGASKALAPTGEILTADALPRQHHGSGHQRPSLLPGILGGVGQGETFEVKGIKGIAGDFRVPMPILCCYLVLVTHRAPTGVWRNTVPCAGAS